MIDGAGTHNYTYNSLNRLTAATHPNQPNESYSNDDVGNRTASHHGSSYSYQAFNRLVTANGAMFGYDTNGSLTSKTDASGTWIYTWDYENRLKQASKSGGVKSSTATTRSVAAFNVPAVRVAPQDSFTTALTLFVISMAPMQQSPII